MENNGHHCKSALIIGGTRGMGAAMALQLKAKGFEKVVVVGHSTPDFVMPEGFEFLQLDLSKDNLSVIKEYIDVDALIITAGIGRLASFISFDEIETAKIIKTNTLAVLQILAMFRERLVSNKNFECGVVTSIAGLVVSPMFAAYSASKAALCKYIEAVNTELKLLGSNNVITNIAPGFIENTSFYGQETNLEELQTLAENMLDAVISKKKLYIPKYEEIYQGVIERYNADPVKFAEESYAYKQQSKNINNKSLVKIGYLSGTFDLFHVGHLNLIQRAKKYCDYLIVGVHKDASHKGKITFIPAEERMRIVGAIKEVDKVVVAWPEDDTAWDNLHYDYLFVGSDYKGTLRFQKYEEYFKDKGVQIIYFPYTQGTSSTKLRSALTALSEYSELRRKEE